jgi:arylsulfatase A-like enzyme
MRVLSVPLLLALSCSPARRETGTPPAGRPNLVFILADDLGWTDLGCQGSKYYESPHIDRLARDGVRLRYGYSAGPNCQPTRAALLSGLYGPRTGIYTVGSIDRFDWSRRPLRPVDNVQKLAPATLTVAEALRKAGYATGMFGKWHLGEDPEHHPKAQGFDEAVVSMGRHFDFKTNPPVPVPKDAYLADWLTERGLDFIRRNRERPFFLYLPHFGVHSPHEAKPELVERFRRKAPAGGHADPVYAAMIASVDESVGRVTALLEELGLAENTLVVFSSDNGGVGGYIREGLRKAGDVTDNAPLRGGKGMLVEGGIRVPYLFRWPGRLPAGTTSDAPFTSVDLYPTLIEAAGVPPEPGQILDGRSRLDVLAGGPDAPRTIYWHFPGYLGAGKDAWRTTPVGALREGPWKLLEYFEDGRLELYDLAADPGERENLAASRPEKAEELRGRLAAWRNAVDAPMPARK